MDDRGMPTLTLAGMGFLAGFTAVSWWLARVAWGVTHDRCGQSHGRLRA